MNDSLPNPAVGDPIKASHIRAITTALKKRTPRPSSSIAVVESDGGFYLELVGSGQQGASNRYPFKIKKVNEELINVLPGTILGEMPVIDTVRLDVEPPPTLAVSTTATEYVVATITGVPILTGLSGRIFNHGSVSITVTITIEEEAPTSADLRSDIGTFKILIATLDGGEVTYQNLRTSIQGYIVDLLDGSGDADLIYHSV